MSTISNSCVEQAFIVIIIIVSVNVEQWHKCSANNEEFLRETKHMFVLTWFAIHELILKRF